MNHQKSDQTEAIKYAVVAITGIIFLAGALYISYRYSQGRSSRISIPAGSTYLGPTGAKK